MQAQMFFPATIYAKNHKIFEESTAVNTEAINLKRLNLKVVIFLLLLFKTCADLAL